MILVALLALALDTPPAEAVKAEEVAPASGPRIYVVKPALSGMPPSLVPTVTSSMAQAIAREGFTVITADDVRTVIDQQADLSLLGGDSDPLALSALANAVGADILVAAAVASVDGDTVVQVRLIDPKKSAVLARRELKASENNNEVLPTIENAARLVLQPLLADGRASVAFSVSEEGANVVVDGDVVGVTPLDKPVGLTGGIHQIVVSKEGFVRFQETVRVKSGDALAREVRLKPSAEFLAKYNGDAGLYRTLAWVSTGSAVVAGAATGALGAGYFVAYQDFEATVDRNEAEAKTLPDGDPRIQELNNQNTDAANAVLPWQGGAITAGVITGVTGLLAVYFWVFGNDPGKYADLEAPVH